MTYFALVWIAYTCPGGSLLSGAWPEAAKPLACKTEVQLSLYDPARLSEAEKKLEELGKNAQLFPCEGLKRGDGMAEWSTVVKFKEVGHENATGARRTIWNFWKR